MKDDLRFECQETQGIKDICGDLVKLREENAHLKSKLEAVRKALPSDEEIKTVVTSANENYNIMYRSGINWVKKHILAELDKKEK